MCEVASGPSKTWDKFSGRKGGRGCIGEFYNHVRWPEPLNAQILTNKESNYYNEEISVAFPLKTVPTTPPSFVLHPHPQTPLLCLLDSQTPPAAAAAAASLSCHVHLLLLSPFPHRAGICLHLPQPFIVAKLSLEKNTCSQSVWTCSLGCPGNSV